MRKIQILIFALLISVMSVTSLDAGQRVEEFRDKEYDFTSIKTILVMPVIYDITIPQSESFFNETLQQKWKESVFTEKNSLTFILKVPKQILERHNFIKGTEATEAISSDKMATEVMVLAPEYTDAYITMTVTKCEYGSKYHPEQITWETRYEQRPVLINGKWEMAKVPVKYQKVKPAWNEKYASGAVKLEFRSSKSQVLIYGVTVNSDAYGDFFDSVPSLTKHISNLIEAAAKRIPRK